MNINKALEGKRIRKADVDAWGIIIVFDDNTVFEYEATDGGHSRFELHDKAPSWCNELFKEVK